MSAQKRRTMPSPLLETLPHFFTIPHTTSFLPCLARGLLTLLPSSEERANAIVYLPYARATQAFRRILINENQASSLLLPRLESLKGIEGFTEILEDDALSFEFTMHPLKRQSELTRLIRYHQIQEAQKQKRKAPPFLTALHLSQALIQLLDQATIEEINLSLIEHLVPEEFAAHWQLTLDFLQLILTYWPQHCREQHLLEPYLAYRQHVDALIDQWEQAPPSHWVILAGSTGTMPTTVRLMQAIARLPKGVIIFPGLGSSPFPEHTLSPTHPQYSLQRLFKKLHISRDTVSEWPRSPVLNLPLEQALAQTFQDTTPEHLPPISKEALYQKVTGLPCDTLEEESLVIALLLRHALETPKQNATLVTPNRTLIRYVQTHLKRWGLSAEDSSGTPLRETPLAGLSLLLLDFLTGSSQGALPFLTLLKHPLTAFSRQPHLKQHWIALLECEVLRNPSLLLSSSFWQETSLPPSPHQKILQKGLSLFHTCISPLFDLFSQGMPLPLKVWIEAHLKSLQRLIHSPLPWETAGGHFFSQILTDLLHQGQAYGELFLEEYRDLLEEIFKNKNFLDASSSHPRLHILGTIEARLLTTDVMILGGLNEGVWPTEDPVDPWLSRPMRTTLGLPPLERRVGLMAHDFCQAFSAQHLFLTRSTRVEGTPSIPSRFWLRLQTTLEAAGLTLREDPSWRLLAQQLQRPDQLTPETPPYPRPPLEARPQQLSVTQIELWKRDPYALYAHHILKLRSLKALDRPLDQALFGTLLHDILAQAIHASSLPLLEHLLEIGQKTFAPYSQDLMVQVFWWPRFQQIAQWVIETETHKRSLAPLQHIFKEVSGRLTLPHSKGIFTLTARADRLDFLADGSVDVIDYKTGSLPLERDLTQGVSPQLPLEAAILLKGGFSALPASSHLSDLSYWSLKGRDKSHVFTLKGDAHQIAVSAITQLLTLIETFNDPLTPYLAQPSPTHAPSYNDYAHLERLAAWR